MARITPEQIEQINEVYAECGVKSKTAKIVGVSVASVTKYLQADYIPKAQRQEIKFDLKEELSCNSYLCGLRSAANKFEAFFKSMSLNEDEKIALAALQKEAL